MTTERKGRVNFTCKNCEKVFSIPHCWAYPKNGHFGWTGKFCNLECKKEWTVKSRMKNCLSCGEAFQSRNSPSKLGKTQYCSRKCWDIRAKEMGGELTAHLDNPDYRRRGNEKKRMANRVGPKSHSFKTGLTMCSGYWKVSSAVYGDKNINKLYHRMVMEQHLGRSLRTDEVVHHKDHNKLNNAIENLQLMTQQDHTRLHHLGVPKKKKNKVLSQENQKSAS